MSTKESHIFVLNNQETIFTCMQGIVCMRFAYAFTCVNMHVCIYSHMSIHTKWLSYFNQPYLR